MVKGLPEIWKTWVQSLGQEDPWRRKQQPTPELLPRKFHGWRSLVGYSPWACKESDTTEQLHFTIEVLIVLNVFSVNLYVLQVLLLSCSFFVVYKFLFKIFLLQVYLPRVFHNFQKDKIWSPFYNSFQFSLNYAH